MRLAGVVFLLCSPLVLAASDLANRVIVLANAREPQSVELARFYAAQRGVPAENVIALPMPLEESITWRQFIDQVYQPLQDELFRRGWIEGTSSSLLDRLGRKRYAFGPHRISYLVTCRGVPLRIFNDPTLLGPARFQPELAKNEAAVDSELSLLAFSGKEITGLLANPLFEREGHPSFEGAQVVKVCRLDGPTWESAQALVTSALAAEASGVCGRYYVDAGGPHAEGNAWLLDVEAQLRDLGFDGDREDSPQTFEATARFDAPVFYFGWYTANLDGPMAATDFTFPPGAVALHIHSYSAQTLHNGQAGWCGPLVAHGVTATVGNVFEPYLSFTHRPGTLVRWLARGRNFGDAVYAALPALSWQEVAIGDPLYTPFKVSLAGQLAASPRNEYAVLREANRRLRAGQKAEAISLLREQQAAQPDLVVGLALARVLAADADSAGVRSALDFATKGAIGAAQWPLARAAARLLAAHDGAKAALAIYLQLADLKAPTPEGRQALLLEARDLAEKKGEPELALEFAHRLGAPAATDASVP